MLNVHLETPKNLNFIQRIELQKRLVEILAKKYVKDPTEANKYDLKNEIRILSSYEPEINIEAFLSPILDYDKIKLA